MIRVGDSVLKLRPMSTSNRNHARYFGAKLSERTLVPGDDAQLGETRFEGWLSASLTQR
jgi:hypothetical protein